MIELDPSVRWGDVATAAELRALERRYARELAKLRADVFRLEMRANTVTFVGWLLATDAALIALVVLLR